MLQISQSISPEEAVQPMEIQQVIQLYQQLIYGIALTGTGGNRADAEDVFQETFLAYFQANVSRRRTSESMADSDSLQLLQENHGQYLPKANRSTDGHHAAAGIV